MNARGVKGRGRTGAALVALALLGAGCSPQVKFVRTECLYVPQAGSPGNVSFVSSLEARNIANEQLIYRVSFERPDGSPLRAPGTQFRDRSGHVAATKSYFCPKSPWTIDDARVSIPANQLGITPEDRVVTAVFSVDRADGTNLAVERLRLPLARVHRALSSEGLPTTRPAERPARPPRRQRAAPSEQSHPRRSRPRPRVPAEQSSDRTTERPSRSADAPTNP